MFNTSSYPFTKFPAFAENRSCTPLTLPKVGGLPAGRSFGILWSVSRRHTPGSIENCSGTVRILLDLLWSILNFKTV